MAITILKDGPILVDVDASVFLSDNNGQVFNIQNKEKVALCRCGLSDNKPFCDGAHKGVFVSDVKAK